MHTVTRVPWYPGTRVPAGGYRGYRTPPNNNGNRHVQILLGVHSSTVYVHASTREFLAKDPTAPRGPGTWVHLYPGVPGIPGGTRCTRCSSMPSYAQLMVILIIMLLYIHCTLRNTRSGCAFRMPGYPGTPSTVLLYAAASTGRMQSGVQTRALPSLCHATSDRHLPDMLLRVIPTVIGIFRLPSRTNLASVYCQYPGTRGTGEVVVPGYPGTGYPGSRYPGTLFQDLGLVGITRLADKDLLTGRVAE
eukprot:3555084-Rhodomonas_salina.2